MKRSHRMAVALVLATSVVAVPAARAETSENFMFAGQGLSAGNAKASGASKVNLKVTQQNSDHSACPAVAQGYGGYTSTPNGGGNGTWADSTRCGQGFKWWSPNGTNCCSFHGAVWNKNQSTFDTIQTVATVFWY